MRLKEDWRKIAKKAWSFRLAALAGLLSTCEMVLPMFIDAMPRRIFAILSFFAITGSLIARVTVQKDMLP